VLELTPTRACVVICLGQPEALDVVPEAGSFSCRVAPDELLLIGPRSRAEPLEERAGAALAELDPHGLVVDQTDGWSGWTLSGHDRDEALGRISDVMLPSERPTFLQGAVADVQGRIIVCRERTHLFVVSVAGDFIRQRLFAACADLKPAVTDPVELDVDADLARIRMPGGEL
jgi:hypothetical protein